MMLYGKIFEMRNTIGSSFHPRLFRDISAKLALTRFGVMNADRSGSECEARRISIRSKLPFFIRVKPIKDLAERLIAPLCTLCAEDSSPGLLAPELACGMGSVVLVESSQSKQNASNAG